MEKPNEIKPLHWLIAEAKPYWRWFLSGVCSAAIMAAGEIGGVHLIKLLVDSALGKDQDRLLPLMCLMIGLMIATALSRYLSSYASGKITALFSSRLRRDLVDHITQISFAGIKKRHSSDVISRLYDDTSQIAHFV